MYDKKNTSRSACVMHAAEHVFSHAYRCICGSDWVCFGMEN